MNLQFMLLYFITISIYILVSINPDGMFATDCQFCKIKKCKENHKDAVLSNAPTNFTACDLAKGMNRYAPVLRDFTCFPPWMNYTKFVEGQRFLEKHHGKIGATEHFTLMGLLAMPDMSDILLFTLTGDCPSNAYKRIITTTRQITLWGQSNLKYSAGSCILMNSIEKVVEVHAHAGQRVRRVKKKMGSLLNEKRFQYKNVNSKLWNAFKKDLEKAYSPQELQFSPCYVEGMKNSVLLNQFQYAMTQWSFSAMATLNPKLSFLGKATDKELDSFNHFWGVIGYLVGMENQYNIALKGRMGLKELQHFYKDILKTYIIPSLYNVNQVSKYLIEETIRQGYGMIHKSLNVPSNFPKFLKEDSFILGLCRTVLNIPCKNTFKASSPAAKLFIRWINLSLTLGDGLTNLDALLNSAAKGQFAFWGNTYYGLCYNQWENNYCQLSDKLHYKYEGPDFNPDGKYHNFTCRKQYGIGMGMKGSFSRIMNYCNL